MSTVTPHQRVARALPPNLSAKDIADDWTLRVMAKSVAATSDVVAQAHHRAFGHAARIIRIYFIQQGNGGPIKIGHAIDVQKRLAMLQCGNPGKLRLLAWFGAGAAVEGALHKHFRKHRLRGEWFRPTNEIWAYIDRVKEFTGSSTP